MTLKTDADLELEVLDDFAAAQPIHQDVSAAFEHGQWWVTCHPCGAQWAVNDAGANADFELVTDGDGWCELQGD